MRPILLLVLCLLAPAIAAEPGAPAADAAVPDSPQAVRPATVGSRIALDTPVRRTDGEVTTLGGILAAGPTAVIFYRGGWCPYCTRHLAGLGSIVPELTAAGWRIVAVAPDQPAVLTAATADGDGGVARFSDADGALMRAFGVAFRVDDATLAKLTEYRIDLAAASGRDHHWLPVPAVFLVAADGTIRFAHADPDYKVRLDPQALLAVARGAQR